MLAMFARSCRWSILLLLVGLTLAAGISLAAAPAKQAPAPLPPIVVNDWIGEGEGKTLNSPAGFAQEGKQPLVVTNSKLGQGQYLVTGDVLMPTAGAAFRVSFLKSALSAQKAKPPADAKDAGPAPLAPFALTLDKDGKTLHYLRANYELAKAAETRLPLTIVVTKRRVEVVAGPADAMRTREADQPVDVVFVLTGGAGVQNLKVTEIPESNLVPVLKTPALANTTITGPKAEIGKIDASSLPQGLTSVDGIPFFFASGEKNALDIAASMSGLKEPFGNKGFFYTANAAKNGRLLMQVPGNQYSALHVIAFSAGRKDHVPRTTVRVGHYGGAAAILEDAVVNVPSLTDSSSEKTLGNIPVKLYGGKRGYLHHVRVPMPQSGNVKEFGTFDLEFTRDMNTHVMPPDPNTFGQIAIGAPSDVVLLAATLEPSPVTMTYTSGEPGNVYFDTQKATFKLTLTNRSAKPAAIRASATATGPGTGEEHGIEPKQWTVEKKLQLKAGESRDVDVDVTPGKRGWYRCTLSVEADGQLVQQRDTTMAVLAPDTRKAVADSPFGIWEFWYPHSVARNSSQVETLAKLINKGGWRWTYGGHPSVVGEDGKPVDVIDRIRKDYKITWNASSLPDGYQRGEGVYNAEKFKEEMPTALAHAIEKYDPIFKVMHESRSSLDLLRRYSEYLGGKPYDMPAAEREKLEKQFENVKNYCIAVKKLDPRAKIVLFNDYPSVVFQFLSRGFPKDAFDVIGLEGAMFLRQPERQPDWLSLLGHMHEMKRAMKKFGYDKPIWTTEALYHPTEAGALSLHDQGVIAVREAMMALQLGVSRMAAAGILKDPSDDYHWSNWGSAGYCFRDPEINPKPSYAMYAWLTQVLDQAKPAGKLAVPNTSLHVADFKKPDGSHVYGIWTASGVQEVSLQANGKVQVFDAFGNTVEPGKGLTLSVSPTPQYVTGTLTAVTSATPVEVKRGLGTPIFEFDKAAQFTVAKDTNPVLESNWDTPRIKGEFATEFVEEDGASALKISLKPDQDDRKLLPRYVEYQLAKPLVLEGRPYQFALRVKGNGAWGRIAFEVVDAKGRVWTSTGNQYAGASNAADPHGYSFISFDGWQTMQIPIMGMYPTTDQSMYWPFNYDWWPTKSPEDVELKVTAETMKTQFETELKAYEEAKKQYAVDLTKWEADKAAAEKEKKKAPAAPKAPVEPKLKSPRNMGYAVVDYPIKLTKVIVTMRPDILYLDEERKVENPVVFIDKMGVIQPPAGM